MTSTVDHGTGRSEGGTQILHFELRLPHPVDRVWAAVATPEGLRGWLAAADVLEPRLGGAVTLRRPATGAEGRHTSVEGRITAWDVEHVAEYTVDVHDRMRFHLEPAGSAGTTVRFTNEFNGDDKRRPDRLACWHSHFEYLVDALDGRPVDWSGWTPERRQELHEAYAARERDVSRP
ncbi:SRPBCC domain-containing protein [Streptomyces sp. NPDC002668]|uniref:SRPBCC domain-containing protein n=1 Tax=Streptomyces sp. NPDC002668 TaxID=3154422 RepID=UPI0033339ECA